MAETFDWTFGLDEKFRNATAFYAAFILATLAGAVLDMLDIDPIKALYWTAILNGLLAPFLLVSLLLISNDQRVMNGQVSSVISRRAVMLTTAAMFFAAIAMIVVQ